MSKILSWDVGIKNLAFCMLQKEENKFKILDWGVINLVDDTQLCQTMIRGGEKCSNIAKYKIFCSEDPQLINTELCVCEKHKEKVEPKLTDIIIKEVKPKSKQIISEILTCSLCDLDATCKISNIGELFEKKYCWCNTHKKKGILFEKKIKVRKITSTNCNKKPIQLLAEKLFSKLDLHENFMQVDEVLIENQPSLINMTMKTISSMLYSYFVLRGMIDKKYNSTIQEVKFISPSNKLKVSEDNTNSVLKKVEKTQVYKMTKKLSVKYCDILLNDEWKKVFAEFKKKDDPADAFLQGLRCMFGDDLPEEYINKLKIIGFEDDAVAKKPTKKIKEIKEKDDTKIKKPSRKNVKSKKFSNIIKEDDETIEEEIIEIIEIL
jgi:hypothetical protein